MNEFNIKDNRKKRLLLKKSLREGREEEVEEKGKFQKLFCWGGQNVFIEMEFFIVDLGRMVGFFWYG